MRNIDISKLEKNDATRPIHTAAGISVWDSRTDLSPSEALLYSIHEAVPDTDIQSYTEAQQFLGTIGGDRRLAIQKRASNMFGVAELLTKGGTIRLPDREWRMESIEVPAVIYQGAYFENPSLSFDDLQKKVTETEGASRLRVYQRETSDEISETVFGGISDGIGGVAMCTIGTVAGVLVGGGLVAFSAPLVASLGVGLGLFGLMAGLSFGFTPKALKEIHIPFLS